MLDTPRWADLLRARAALGITPDHAPAGNGPGSRRPADAAFLAARGHQPPPTTQPDSADESLWHALATPDADRRTENILAVLRAAPRCPADMGALVPQGMHRTIEVWTETELCALHALSRLAHRHKRGDWRDAALDAARWHIDNLQPDNATNRPWAIHLFVILADDGPSFEANLYAETLLHNCLVNGGKPDAVSALILLDAAEMLECPAP